MCERVGISEVLSIPLLHRVEARPATEPMPRRILISNDTTSCIPILTCDHTFSAIIMATFTSLRSFASSLKSSHTLTRRCLSSCSQSAPPPPASSLPPVHLSYIPHLVPYKLGLALQESIYALRGSPEVLLLLQHTPVYTEGRRGPQSDEASSSQITEEKRLTAVGADYVVTQRGGLITYHGPGQLVGYPILHLGKMGVSCCCPSQRFMLSIELTHPLSLLPTHSFRTDATWITCKTPSPPSSTRIHSQQSHHPTTIRACG